MANIRNPGSIRVRERPVTMTAPSMLDNITGFVGSVAQLGQAFRGLSQRRSNEKYAEEAASTARLLSGIDSELGPLRLQVGNDLGAWREALKPMEQRFMEHVEGLSDPRSQKDAWDRWSVITGQREDDIVSKQGAALEKVREEAAWNATVAAWGAPGEHGRKVWSDDPAEAKRAAQVRVTATGLYTDPDNPLMQRHGPAAAAAGATRYINDFDEGVIHGYLDAQSEKNLPAAIQQVTVSGAPVPGQPGTFAGQGMDASGRMQAIRRWMEKKSAADDIRAGQIEVQEELEAARQDDYKRQFFNAFREGGYMDPADAPTRELELWAIQNETKAAKMRTPAQDAALAEALANAERAAALVGTSEPTSLQQLATLQAEAFDNEALHPRDVYKVADVFTQAMRKARDHDDLPATEKRVVAAEKAWGDLLPGVPTTDEGRARLTVAGWDLDYVTKVDNWFRRAIGRPDIDPNQALSIARTVVNFRSFGLAPVKLADILMDPKNQEFATRNPYALLSALPSVQHSDLVMDPRGGINKTATDAAMLRTLMKSGLSMEDAMSSTPYLETLEVLEMLAKGDHLDLHVDPVATLRQEEAVAEEEAAQSAAQVAAETPVGQRRRRRAGRAVN